jgi:hypothetical protein
MKFSNDYTKLRQGCGANALERIPLGVLDVKLQDKAVMIVKIIFGNDRIERAGVFGVVSRPSQLPE